MPIPSVGILILNYHEPAATLACIRSFLEKEGPETVILWIENDANHSGDGARRSLEDSGLSWTELPLSGIDLPQPSQVGLIRVPENLGYAGGNNVGLRRLHAAGVTWSWVLNNDTLLTQGCSRDLVALAETKPEVGLWGMCIRTEQCPCYFGGVLNLKNFSIQFAKESADLEKKLLCFISGCAMFFRTAQAAEISWIPEDFFLYFEDPAFSIEFQRQGFALGFNPTVEIYHHESLSTGRRSWLMEFYNRRNRWHFIQRYFPDQLKRQLQKRWHIYQKLFFRGKWKRIQMERLALKDFMAGRLGPTHRDFSKSKFI
jgi:GT2 family glycosyltransferase